jgi:hypothetical protein
MFGRFGKIHKIILAGFILFQSQRHTGANIRDDMSTLIDMKATDSIKVVITGQHLLACRNNIRRF